MVLFYFCHELLDTVFSFTFIFIFLHILIINNFQYHILFCDMALEIRMLY